MKVKFDFGKNPTTSNNGEFVLYYKIFRCFSAEAELRECDEIMDLMSRESEEQYFYSVVNIKQLINYGRGG